jgi:hypothetical protein
MRFSSFDFLFSNFCFQAVRERAASEQDAMFTATALQPDISPQAVDLPIITSARVGFPQSKVVVEFQFWQHKQNYNMPVVLDF